MSVNRTGPCAPHTAASQTHSAIVFLISFSGRWMLYQRRTSLLDASLNCLKRYGCQQNASLDAATIVKTILATLEIDC